MAATELSDRLRVARRALDRQVGEARQIAHTGTAVAAEVMRLRDEVTLYEKAAGVLASLGEERQAATQQQIEFLVTKGLQTIFGAELSFRIEQSIKGKTPVVDFVVRTTLADGRTIDTDLMSARGGGLVAVVSFLLRLVVLLLSRGKQENLLVLDESFAMLSKDYAASMAEFLRELVDKTGTQILLVTHQDQFADVADKRYEFRLIDGWTEVKEI